VAAIHERIEADEGKAARPTLNAHQDKIEGLEGRIARLEDDIFQRATPSYLGKVRRRPLLFPPPPPPPRAPPSPPTSALTTPPPGAAAKSTAGENRGPVVRRAGFDQPDPKAAIQVTAPAPRRVA
jgi:hypothetical protein